jgi:4,5-DOPA dioxygenase extradiol
MTDSRWPAIFFGHGNPMNALGGPYADTWGALGERLPKPRAVLMFSAHWYVPALAVTAMKAPRTIHDFGGFPDELFRIQYPAPGDETLARRVAELLAPTPVALDREWGLDHGAWSVLMHVFPGADVPVVQISLDTRLAPRALYELGRKLAPFRDERVLVAGSGDVVHNLRRANLRGPAEPYEWATRFQSDVQQAIASRRHDFLIDYERAGEAADLSIPTPEHYLPLLPLLGMHAVGEPVEFFNASIDAASVGMLGAVLGAVPAR